ncbi:myb/SANT-like domain-containing protein [Artemisia annua]|uniref:Myb/SANT-like domain-containing protein n=1 Tax=Artemisia annua TaxID=35608 RepID=A0A2U1NVW8_ARTAN|nr:myb/SANT-like domain-containing protein [Artemisia annua]
MVMTLSLQAEGKRKQKNPPLWDNKTHLVFVELCLNEARLGNKPCTHFNKIGYENLIKKLKENTGKNLTYKQIKNHWESMKKDWKLYDRLMRLESGIGWDPIRKIIDASPEWWDEKIKDKDEVKQRSENEDGWQKVTRKQHKFQPGGHYKASNRFNNQQDGRRRFSDFDKVMKDKVISFFFTKFLESWDTCALWKMFSIFENILKGILIGDEKLVINRAKFKKVDGKGVPISGFLPLKYGFRSNHRDSKESASKSLDNNMLWLQQWFENLKLWEDNEEQVTLNGKTNKIRMIEERFNAGFLIPSSSKETEFKDFNMDSKHHGFFASESEEESPFEDEFVG